MVSFLKKIFLFVFTVLLLPSCISPARFTANQEFDFSRVKNYSMFSRNSDFTNFQHISDFNRNRIEIAIENAMEVKQYDYTDLDNADVVVSYYLVGKSLKSLQQYNRKVKACLGCTLKQQNALNKDMYRSTLIIDVLDGKRLRTVYRSFTKLKVDVENNSDENQEIIIDTVERILQNLPSKNI